MTRARSPWLALCALLLGLFVMNASSTSLNTAIPAIGSSLGATFDQLLWVINIFTLMLTMLGITAGRLGDLYGPKKLYLVGLSLFAIASVIGGIAQSVPQLVVARLIQGIGAALVSPQSLVMISRVFPPERRGSAIGIWGAVAGAAVAVGPSLGGVMVTAWGWRSIFLANVPVCAVGLALAAMVIPDLAGGRRRRLDLLGSVLSSSGLLLIAFGLIEGHPYGWGQVWGPITIPVLLGAGIAVVGLFVVVERGRQDREPLLPFTILRDRNFSLMSVVTITLVGATGAMLLLLSIYLQSALGMSALQAGLVMAVAPTVSIVFAPVFGRMTDRRGGKPVLIAGLLLFTAGLVYVVLVASVHLRWWDLLPGLVLVGVAMGVTFAPPNTIAMFNIDTSMAGAASGTLNMIRTFGSVIGAALVGAILQSQLASSLRDSAAVEANTLPADLRDPLISGVARATAGGLDVGQGQFTIPIPPSLSSDAVNLLKLAAQHSYADGLTSAVRTTFMLPAALLLVSTGLTLAVRHKKVVVAQPVKEKQCL